MKKTIVLLFAISSIVNASAMSAGDEKFIQSMQKNIQIVYEAKSPLDIQTAVNAFERISAVETSRWEPHYYAAFGNLMLCNAESDGAKKDQYIDLAFVSIKKAKELKPDDSEITALEGFAYMMRVTVDPASRGAQFAGLSVQTFQQAIAQNPENPRPLMLLAQMQYGTAQFFGSPTTEACETLGKSLAKFETHKSDNPIAPQWGKQMAIGLKQNCK